MKNKAWPTSKAMLQIYELNLWGGNEGVFYSGEGSHNLQLVEPYVLAVNAFLNSFETSLIVADLGCGDYNIGKQLLDASKAYIAVDVVESLIAYNKTNFKNKGLEFKCLDIVEQKLPFADVAIIRQVLQHLSNNDILKIVAKLYQYKYVILTEHIPNVTFTPNVDIISGQGIRLKKQSGVNLLAEPFCFKVKEVKDLVKINLGNSKGIIVTKLYVVK